MKMKSWVLWLLVVAFLASEVFLFSANRQKDAALVSLRESKQQADDLQAQLDSLKKSEAESQNAELSQLRADNKDLPRLRNEVTQLQVANQKLKQQLSTTLTAAQQQQEQLQQIAAENQAFRTADENQARATEQAQTETQAESARDTCINHLRQIDAAKNQWALENNKVAGDIPTAQDIAPYIKLDANGNIPGCPSGGTYMIGAVGVPPTCSIPGHVLP
jgi:DNA repair exonuclease SbcCD ATPase subunit